MIKLYDFPLSGHAHRIRLMLSLLNLEYQCIHVKLDQGEHLEAAFTKINPLQQIPVLEDDGFVIHDSVAILCYLAIKYDSKWYPQDANSIALIQEWLAIATKELATGPAAARLVNVFGAELDHQQLIEQSHIILKNIDQHLKGRQWLALDTVSIADVAAYTYIAHAPEGDVSLASYANINAWLARVENLTGFVAMDKSPVKLAS